VNQVDAVIVLVVVASAISGARRGFIASAGDIAAAALGLGAAALGYPLFGAAFRAFGFPSPLAEVLGFVAFAALVVVAVGWAASRLSERLDLPRRASRAGGATMGGVLGVVLATVLVLLSGMITGTGEPVQRSLLGRHLVTGVPRLHVAMESIGVPLPKLVQLPASYHEELAGVRQGLQFLRLNSVRLNGATCIHCRTPVVFEGYQFVHGTLMSPRFRCPNCGRTSDGCQTFEGFHEIYGTCPTGLADDGVLFDCGVWTNGWWTVPHGHCPVCGKEHRLTPDEERLGPPRPASSARLP
jgi:uncharacterized membrane protein required for colicin V production